MNRLSLAIAQIGCGLAIWMIASKIIEKLFIFFFNFSFLL
jgi:hypothetical protein